MKEKKFYIVLDNFERRVIVNCINEMRNSLIEAGKCTDTLDEVMLKVIRSKQKKLNKNKTSAKVTLVCNFSRGFSCEKGEQKTKVTFYP